MHAAFGEAVAHYRSGLACLERAPEGRPRQERTLSLDILMANALMGSNGLGSADLLPIWERAIALAEELGDQEELTSALNGAAVYYADHGEDDVAIAMAERIVAIADATGSRVAALRGNGTLGMTRFFRGEGERALAHTELALSLSREGDFESVTYGVGHDEGVFFHAMASWNLWWLGRPDAGLSRALEGSRQADALPSSLTQAMARHAVAMIRLLRGEGVHASVVAGENLRLTEEVGLPFWRGLALLVLGTELARRGDESGLGQLDLGLGLLLEEGNQGGASLGLALLADAQLHLGRFEQAIATADAGLATSASLHQPFYDPELLRLKALALDEESGNRTQAVALLEQSLALAQQLGTRSWALTTATSLALLLGRAAGGAAGPGRADPSPGRDGRRRRHRRPAARPCPPRPAALGPLPPIGSFSSIKEERHRCPRPDHPCTCRDRCSARPTSRSRTRSLSCSRRPASSPTNPGRDGIELAQVMGDINAPPLPADVMQLVMPFVRKLVFAVDVYQLLDRCRSVVFNLDGRVPDDGSVMEAAVGWTAGLPVVIYKTTPVTMLGGQDNPMVAGLAMRWTDVADVADLPRALAGAVALDRRLGGPKFQPGAHAAAGHRARPQGLAPHARDPRDRAGSTHRRWRRRRRR